MDQLYTLIAKLGTVLIDRRFWMYLLSLGVIIGLVPATVDTEKMSNDLVGALELIMAGVTALGGLVMLVYSWTKRPPSGMNYKPEINEVVATLLKEVKARG